LRAALKLDDTELINEAFNSCDDPLVKKQLAFALGRQRQVVECDDQELNKLMSNSMVSEYFKKLCVDLDTTKPKKPEEIYKAQFEHNATDGKLSSA
jgi:26S proteasome regulatory subunit N1